MVSSRKRRISERKLISRTIHYFILSLALIVFIVIIGPRLLINFSLLVSGLPTSNGQPVSKRSAFLLPPSLDPQPSATNSSSITVSGSGQPATTVVLIQNGQAKKRVLIGKDGLFSFSNLQLQPGENYFEAKVTEDGRESDMSNRISIFYKSEPPKIEISSPEPDTVFREENNEIEITGHTEKDATLKINDRIVPLRSDGSFSFSIKLTDGENIIKFKATDIAGNQTEKELKVTYEP